MTQLVKQEGCSVTPKESDVLTLIPLAMERVAGDLDARLMVNMAKDIVNEFPNVTTDVIRVAMKKGALGHFGKTYKFSTQEVCIWIREEMCYRSTHNPDGMKKVSI